MILKGFMIHRTKSSTVSDLGVLMTLFLCLFLCLLLALLLLSFAVSSEQNHRLLAELWEILKSFCLKYHLHLMDLEYRSGAVFPSNLNLLHSEYIKFQLFALFTEFLNSLIITAGEKNSSHLSSPSYLGKSECQC